ncbi:MAG: Ldh family oxidoreductase [Pseudomonadota bacterium]
MDKETISITEAEALIKAALTANGVAEVSACAVASALVAAEAEGQVGHGFSRLGDYVAQVKTGKVDGRAIPSLTEHGASSILVDAGHGFAYPAMDLAIREGTKRAKAQGTASMAITRSHHCGALSLQVEKIARAGSIGIMVANAPAAIAPWGARTPVFGTNPIAFAAPRVGADPLVIDLSLSKVARGKVMHAKKSGTEIPLGWALDAGGQPTTDPEAALGGTMVPIGEAKGTALALMVEILASAMTGANPSARMPSFFTADGPPNDAGQFLMALNPPNPEGFAERMETILGLIEGAEGARLPGTRRRAAIARARSHGIDVPRHYLEAARDLAGG